MCVLFTEDVGGILTLEYDENGNLQFKTEALEADGRFDEIGSALKIKEIQRNKKIFWNPWKCIIKYFSSGISRMRNLRKKQMQLRTDP